MGLVNVVDAGEDTAVNGDDGEVRGVGEAVVAVVDLTLKRRGGPGLSSTSPHRRRRSNLRVTFAGIRFFLLFSVRRLLQKMLQKLLLKLSLDFLSLESERLGRLGRQGRQGRQWR